MAAKKKEPDDLLSLPEPTGSIHARMARVFAGIGTVPKNGYNSFHKYNYTTEADLLSAIKPLMAMQGLFFTSSVQDVQVITPGHVLVQVLYTVWSSAGESIEFFGYGEGMDISSKGGPGDKALYKALTGAMKYALMKTFAVSTGDDPELAPPELESYQRVPPAGRTVNVPATPSTAPLTKNLLTMVAIQGRRVATALEAEGYGTDDAWSAMHRFLARILGIPDLVSTKDLTQGQALRVVELMKSRSDEQVRTGVRNWLAEELEAAGARGGGIGSM